MKKFILANFLVLSSVFAAGNFQYGETLSYGPYKLFVIGCARGGDCHNSNGAGSLSRECQNLGFKRSFIENIDTMNENGVQKTCEDPRLSDVCACVIK